MTARPPLHTGRRQRWGRAGGPHLLERDARHEREVPGEGSTQGEMNDRMPARNAARATFLHLFDGFSRITPGGPAPPGRQPSLGFGAVTPELARYRRAAADDAGAAAASSDRGRLHRRQILEQEVPLPALGGVRHLQPCAHWHRPAAHNLLQRAVRCRCMSSAAISVRARSGVEASAEQHREVREDEAIILRVAGRREEVAAPCTLPWSFVYDASFSNDVEPPSRSRRRPSVRMNERPAR